MIKFYTRFTLLLLLILCGCSYINKKNEDMPSHPLLRDLVKAGGYFEVVYFAVDSFELNIEAEDILMRTARMQAVSKTYVYLSGHADKTGKKPSNFELSGKRVNAAKDYLIGLGVQEDNIHTEYFGDEQPAAEGDNPEAYAKNRRVEIVLANKKPEQK